jgi:GTPase SAR1 family protein
MGNLFGRNKPSGDRTDIQRTAALDSKLYKDAKDATRVIKMLLLGAGESGKSTLFKQTIIMYGGGYDEKMRLSFKEGIQMNIVKHMKILIEAVPTLKTDGVMTTDIGEAVTEIAERVVAISPFPGVFSLEGPVCADIQALWADPAIKEAFQSHRALMQIPDSASYFFDDVTRISSSDYVPSPEDVLKCRNKTTGVIETNFAIGNDKFRLIDVGGQRSERKKWMNCFEDVTAVIYVAAINEYDMKLSEDVTVNRVTEALDLFRTTCNSNWFVNPCIVLFLNKKDLFQQKIQNTDLKVLFPEYDGGPDYDNAVQFLETKFRSVNESDTEIYCHVTCATDVTNVRFTFDAIKKTIINQSLLRAGLA